MDQFRRSGSEGGGGKDQSSPPHINSVRESAFSRPILPTSSSLLLSPPKPKPATGAPNGVTGSGPAPVDPHPPPQAETPSSSSSSAAPGRYKECLRNHAAGLGGHVVDGCGEFMPAGPAEPMNCAACGCHRSFHRREAEPPDGSAFYRLQHLMLPPPPPRTLGFGGSGNTTTESSSEGRAHNYHGGERERERELGGKKKNKKRFRTKFSSEQKEKMMSFAERVQWRVQKKDETEMERFCRDIGVSRQVLKVWMHNNKHLVVRKQQQPEILGKAEEVPEPVPEPEQHHLGVDKD